MTAPAFMKPEGTSEVRCAQIDRDWRDRATRRPSPLRTERFEAFACQGLDFHDGKARPLPVTDATSLDNAVTQAQMHCAHKTHFFIRRTDEFSGAVVLHFYVIREQSKAQWVRRPGMAHPVQERPRYAEHLFDLAVDDAVRGEG